MQGSLGIDHRQQTAKAPGVRIEFPAVLLLDRKSQRCSGRKGVSKGIHCIVLPYNRKKKREEEQGGGGLNEGEMRARSLLPATLAFEKVTVSHAAFRGSLCRLDWKGSQPIQHALLIRRSQRTAGARAPENGT
jgi:hypothetical protein